jgi:hypothetical protein
MNCEHVCQQSIYRWFNIPLEGIIETRKFNKTDSVKM